MNLLHLVVIICCTVAQKTTQKIKSSPSTSVSPLEIISTLSSDDVTTDINITTEATVATCENNSSCFVTTVEPNATESSISNTTKLSPKEKQRRPSVISDTEQCTCDLQLNICDINCCCDQDCSVDDKLIFHHCIESENFYYDTRYCDYMKYIYVNNTPFQWHVNQNGLFCVLKSNLPPSRILQRKEPLASYEKAQQEKVDKFSWPHFLKKQELNFNMTQDFVYGNNIWIVSKDIIKKFKIPKKYFSNTCVEGEDVLNFKPIKNICAQIDISEENEYLHFRNYFENITIVAHPHLLNVSKYKNFQECPKNVCLAILPKICDENFNNCQNISRNSSQLNVNCNFHLRNNKNDCKNLVKALQYRFHHNGTKGYFKVEVLAVLENVSYEFGQQDYEYFQEFQVNFWWFNQTRNFSAVLSGNPGYLIGRPILKGTFINIGNNSNKILKIQRFSSAYSSNFLILPENNHGDCTLNNTNYSPIEFGYNLLTKCNFKLKMYNKKKYFNGTEICRNIQKNILKMWDIIEGVNVTIGMFGNADATAPKNWTHVMYSMSIHELFNKTTGQFNAANSSLTCFGLVSTIIVDVFHSRIDFKTLLNQEKILAVTYTFAGFLNKTMSYNKRENSTYLELNLESRVVFYDISLEKQKKFVDAPTLRIRLPYDFFYPFVKMDNGVGVFTVNIFHVVVCLIILIVK